MLKLPPGLQTLDVSYRRISGGVDLTALPVSLSELMLNNTKLEGHVDFSSLPDALYRFSVAETRLSGALAVPVGRLFLSANSNVHREEEGWDKRLDDIEL